MKTAFTRWLSFIMVGIIMAGIMLSGPIPAFPVQAEGGISKIDAFKFPGSFNGELDASAIYKYSDDFFKKPATQFSWELAEMSLCLELSTWPSNEESE